MARGIFNRYPTAPKILGASVPADIGEMVASSYIEATVNFLKSSGLIDQQAEVKVGFVENNLDDEPI
jgi:hypothetical protein